VAALAGAGDIYGAGMTESGVTFDPAQLVMDDEWIAMIRFFLGGIRVDTETIAGADILAVGSFGDYLSLPATYAHMREQSQPRIIDRRVREDWKADGSPDARARAMAKARELLEEYRPEPLPGDVVREIDRIVAKADEQLAGK
jgi:trimethylamine--corrinoid protein Co-methyltransferase